MTSALGFWCRFGFKRSVSTGVSPGVRYPEQVVLLLITTSAISVDAQDPFKNL